MPRRALLFRLALGLGLLLAVAAVAGWRYLATDLPSLDRLTESRAIPSARLLARDGRLLYQVGDPAGNRHTTVPLGELPPALRLATIATEDASFYSNPGVDLVGIARALWINLTGGEVLAGGSTITQQVARNMLLDPQERAERTLTRKLRESILAWRLAQAYSKDEILELYLNQTYYGHLAYGVEAAARAFFGKSARDLDLAEAALIAGLPQAPSLYDPLLDPAAAAARQAVVLDLMVKQGYLTGEQAQLAKAEPLQYSTDAFPIEAPHFVFYVWSQLEQTYGPEVLYSGLTVTTTLDLNLNRAAQQIATRRLSLIRDNPNGFDHHATDAALVALDPHSGQILALLGSPDYFDARISGAVNMTTAPRQPGSALKPLVYAAAFSPENCPAASGQSAPAGAGDCPWTPATMILDVRTAFVTREGQSYVPLNYDRAFHGPVSARAALAGSLNVPAVVALEHAGLPTVIRLAGRLGLTTLADADRFGLALALGGGEVRLLDLTAAYAALANGGRRVDPVAILEVRSGDGALLYRHAPRAGERVLDERVAFLIADILSDNDARAATFGFNSVLQIGRPAAVKTGTTVDYRDNWTIGYTPELVAGAWVGNADNSPMINLSGVSGAGPIWHEFMRAALAGKPESGFAVPPGLVRAEVCSPSGRLPTPHCQRVTTEWFLAEAAPTRPDDLYQPVRIDTRTGRLADASTPPEFVVERVFLVLPPQAREWAAQAGLPQLPDDAAAPRAAPAGVWITSPDPQTVYQISPRLPLSSQQIMFRVGAAQPIREVTFVLNGRALLTVSQAPFEMWWQLEAGAHRLTARARLAGGETVESAPVDFLVEP